MLALRRPATLLASSLSFGTAQSGLRRCFSLTHASSDPQRFRIVEVGPRDGLQNERGLIPTEVKVELIGRLVNCGLRNIETTSFVSPRWVPQMADQEEVAKALRKRNNVSYSVLVPNTKGLHRLLSVDSCIDEVAVFVAASESFSRKNTNSSIEESLRLTREVVHEALKSGLRVRGYISTVIACPYEGNIKPDVVARLAECLLNCGCYEISLGDTIGVGSAGTVSELLNEVLKVAPVERVAVHFHDTYGQALSSVLVAIDKGIRTADSSVAGLGGCPYAKGATGNLASEDLVYMLHDIGFWTGVDLEKLVETSSWICEKMQRTNVSRVSTALIAKKKQL